MLNILSGKINLPPKVVIYGAEGVGKSTLASQFPDPLFIDTEGSTTYMDVRRLEKPDSFTGLVDLVKAVAAEPDICKTLILDTADWAEQMCIAEVCAKYKKKGIEDFGYGKGYTYISEEFSKLLSAFDAVIKKGICVVITAHAKMRKFEQPDEMGAYDRWEMKLSKQVAPLLKEWCDMLLFCNYKTYVVSTESNTHKAQGGKRVMYTTHHPCWDAKNRHNLPEETDLDFASIAHIFSVEQPESPALQELRRLMLKDHITADRIQWIVAKKGKYPQSVDIQGYPEEFISGWLIPNWANIVEYVNRKENQLVED